MNRGLPNGLFHAMGTSRLWAGTVCDSCSEAAWDATVGPIGGADPESVVEFRPGDLLGRRSVRHQRAFLGEGRGGPQASRVKLVVIDPRRTRSAQVADWHIPIRIGTDAALALGIMHVLVRDNLCDRDYIARTRSASIASSARCCRASRRSTSPPSPALRRPMSSGSPRLYGGAKKSFIRLGWGMTRFTYGGQALRTVALLPGVTGAYGRYGGGALLATAASFELNYNAVRKPSGSGRNPHDQSQPARRGVAGAERSADPRAVHRGQQSGGDLSRHVRRRVAASRARICSPWCTTRS